MGSRGDKLTLSGCGRRLQVDIDIDRHIVKRSLPYKYLQIIKPIVFVSVVFPFVMVVSDSYR